MRFLMPRMKTLLLVTVLALAFAGCSGGAATTDAASADTTPPTTPTGISAVAAGSSAVNLSWNPSTDNVGVTGYIVRRDGTQTATPATTNFSDTGLAPATTYSYAVAARDAAGNVSSSSTSVNVTTSSPVSNDTTPPSTPTGLVAAVVGDARIDLTWNASTDNVGVTGYHLERCQGAGCTTFAQISIPSASPYSDFSSLLPGTTYFYRVRATDGAGNDSGFSSIASATTQAASGTVLPLGALAHDGPATPEQISLILPVTGPLPQTATAMVRYRPTGSPTWITGHPLYRIRPDLALTPGAGSVPDAFAWPIIDVAPGTSYDVEVTVNSGATTNVKTLTHTTRALPAAAGTPTKNITAGSTSLQIQVVFDGLVAGDVLQFANGTYAVSNLQLNVSGADNNPIYIRGQSRTGVVLSNPSHVLHILPASNIVIENMTLQGSGVDSGTASSSQGIQFYNQVAPRSQTRITVRKVTITGVDSAIAADVEISEFLAYDNTFTGNNTWTKQTVPGTFDIDSNLTWNDDAIRIPGFGNCVFNNTIKGFGDSMSFAQHFTEVVGVHFYRNDVLFGGDDGVEVDDGQRNITFYDNRLRNTMTFVSLDPLFGGPFVAARKIAINTGRTPFKWNSQNSGQFLYNNTVVRTTGRYWFDNSQSQEAGWYQANNGDQSAYGYRNNLLVYRGAGTQTLRLDNSGHDPVDFTHNSWYPNAVFRWPQGGFSNLLDAFTNLLATTPVFSGSTRRHDHDNISESDPWVTPIVFPGTDYHTEVTVSYTPILRPGTAPKNTGVVIPNITDGFTGGAPDRGAIIEGRPIPQYGERP